MFDVVNHGDADARCRLPGMMCVTRCLVGVCENLLLMTSALGCLVNRPGLPTPDSYSINSMRALTLPNRLRAAAAIWENVLDVDPGPAESEAKQRARAGRIAGISKAWQNFFISLVLHLGLPLLPLVLERWFSGHIESKSAALTAALYSMAIGLSSRNVALFGTSICICVTFSAAFGFLSKDPELVAADTLSYIVIGLVFVVHAIERYNRHVIDQQPFFEFLTGK